MSGNIDEIKIISMRICEKVREHKLGIKLSKLYKIIEEEVQKEEFNITYEEIRDVFFERGFLIVAEGDSETYGKTYVKGQIILCNLRSFGSYYGIPTLLPNHYDEFEHYIVGILEDILGK